MRESLRLRARHVAWVSLALSVAAAAVATVALGRPSAAAPSVSTGETLFTSVGCSACHTFKAARATGKIGPNLDTVKLTTAQLITQITKGGCAVLPKAACSKYKFSMSPFKPRLTTAQILDVAAFVYSDRNTAPKGPPPATTPTTTAPPQTTTQTTTPTTPVTTPTTTAANNDGCPAGTTIQTSGNTDGDDDETGRPSDLDGCI
jgi:mono/diheme cytochrome c family protein